MLKRIIRKFRPARYERIWASNFTVTNWKPAEGYATFVAPDGPCGRIRSSPMGSREERGA